MVSLQKEKQIQHITGGFLNTFGCTAECVFIFSELLQVRTEWTKK